MSRVEVEARAGAAAGRPAVGGRGRPRVPRVPGVVRTGAPAVALLVALVVLWELAVPSYLLPAPSRGWSAFLHTRGALPAHIRTTLAEAVIGLAVAAVAGAALAAVIASVGLVRRVLYPVLVLTQNIPLVVLAPLLVVWFGFGIRLWVPAAIGRGELALPASLEAFEAMSRVDGAAGWAVTIGTGGGLFAAYLDEPTAAELFGPRDALIAGSGAPGGRAQIVDGGYQAHGAWRFASGAPHATWFTANCVVERDGRPVLDASGAPQIRAMAFPPDGVTVAESWRVSGLRATASQDFAAIWQFVPARRSFSVFTDEPRAPGPLYRVPFATIAELSFAAVALGIARHAIETFAALAAAPRRAGSAPVLSARAGARIRIAEAEATVRSTRAFFYEVAGDTWAAAVAGRALDPNRERLVRLASVHASAAGARVAESLYSAAGMAPLFEDSELGRCWRDAHAVSQHALVSSARYEGIGSGLFDAAAERSP